MLLQELKAQAYQLSVSDRLALVSAIIESLQEPPSSRPISQKERSQAINHQPAPTDAQVQTMLEERRAAIATDLKITRLENNGLKSSHNYKLSEST